MTGIWLRILAIGLTTLLRLPAALAAEPKTSVVDFNREIRPLLSKNCFACHGPDAEQRQAGLRLDVRDAALGRLESGAAAIVPKDAAKSELVRRITSTDADVRMPPEGSGRELSAEQIQRLTGWVEQGAPYAEHWSFVKPQRPALPTVSQPGWARNAIDYFVLAELDHVKLAPAAEADSYQLIRRLSLDLRGLPPTLGGIRGLPPIRNPQSAIRNRHARRSPAG